MRWTKALQTLSYLGTLGLVACSVGPDYKQPNAPVATKYTSTKLPQNTVSTPSATSAGKSQHLNTAQQVPENWWYLFHSPQINELVQQGLNNSPDLASAKATLQEAQDTFKAEVGNLMLPAIDFGADASRNRNSPIQFGSESVNNIFNLYSATGQITYDIDLWGKNRRTLEGYQAQVDYAQYELEGAYLSLSSNIVTTAISIASTERQINVTKEIITAERKILKITQQQYNDGGIAYQSVLLQQTQLAQTQASLPPLQSALAQENHALAVLVGKPTSQQKLPIINLDKIILPTNLPVTLPSSLVAQRPDIQASSALLHVASANIGVAIANILPDLTLSGDYGYTSLSTGDLFTKNKNIWSYGAGLTQPIFHGGGLIYAKNAVESAYNAALGNYQQIVLMAFQNVADALTNLTIDAVAYKRNYQAAKSAKNTFIVTKQQFNLGGVNYLSLLDSQEQYLQTQLQLIKAQATRYSDTVALYQALGGGWWNNPLVVPQKSNGETSACLKCQA